MTLTVAYRDYKSAKEVKAAFAAEKDFVVADIVSPWCGRYVNRKQLVGVERSVCIRFNKNASFVVIDL